MPRNEFGFGRGDYSDIDKPREGSAGFSGKARPRANPVVAQLSTLLFGGTATDGDYVAAFELPDGTELTATVTRASAVPATNADLATAMAAAINGDDAWANVATAEVDGVTPEQVNLTFLHAAIVYPLGASSAPAPSAEAIRLLGSDTISVSPRPRMIFVFSNTMPAWLSGMPIRSQMISRGSGAAMRHPL